MAGYDISGNSRQLRVNQPHAYYVFNIIGQLYYGVLGHLTVTLS